MDSNKQNLINKILYRAQYRGTKEMDIFVTKFVKSIICSEIISYYFLCTKYHRRVFQHLFDLALRY